MLTPVTAVYALSHSEGGTFTSAQQLWLPSKGWQKGDEPFVWDTIASFTRGKIRHVLQKTYPK